MKKIFIWSPFIDHVGTTQSMKNSIYSLSKFGKRNISLSVINVFGEWNFYLEELKKLNVEVINIGIKKKGLLKKKGFIFSRILYLKIFFLSFFPLLKIIKNRNPDYLIVTLITFVPLILNYLFRIKTKIILRISGLPKLNLLRLIFWKIVLSKVQWIFSPTNNTNELLQNKFTKHKEKIRFIRDPIFSYRELLEMKKIYGKNNNRKNFYLAVGRLTKQKNFKSLVIATQKYNLKNKKNKINVLVIGDGEEKSNLKLLSKKLNVEKNIKFIGFKSNKFNYFFKAKALICTSLWEDPGFILIEAGISNLPVISNSCLSGPVEIIDNDKNGYLYKLNSVNSLVEKIQQFEEDKAEIILQKKLNMKICSRKYSISKFYKDFIKYV
jgi:glycosyltransferase involved in cell wall biosynthesis